MTFEQLYYFVRIADSGSITAAANKLFLSQQALSTAVSNLEKELGVSLMQRSRKGIALTIDGEYLYQQSKQLLSAYSNILGHFSSAQPLEGRIKIACNLRHKEFIFANTLSYFYTHYPNVAIDFTLVNRSAIMAQVQNKEVDFGLVTIAQGKHFGYPLPNDLSFISLFEKELSCLVSNDSSYAKNDTISMSETRNNTIVLEQNPNDADDIFHQIIRHYAPEAKIIWADNRTLFYALIRDGAGIGFTAELSNKSISTLNIKPISTRERITIQTGILTLKNSMPSEPCKRCISHLIDNAGDYYIGSTKI